MKIEVGSKCKNNTGNAFGLIVKCMTSGADTSLIDPSDSPISQELSMKLLVAVINYSL